MMIQADAEKMEDEVVGGRSGGKLAFSTGMLLREEGKGCFGHQK